MVEFGSGSGRKTRAILEALAPDDYFPIDISAHALEKCRRELASLAHVEPVEGSYINGLDRIPRNGGAALVLFIGSTIGNFDGRCRADFLRQVRSRLRPGDALLVGCDLLKPVNTMLDAYDDPSGVTASFNLNLLGRINRELGGDFDLRAFSHQAIWNDDERRIEMHLRAREEQMVTVRDAQLECSFRIGETIWTESSHKFHADEIAGIARESGFTQEAQWVDEEWPFAECLWRVNGS